MPLVEPVTFQRETLARDSTPTYATVLSTGGTLVTLDVTDENETAAEVNEHEVRIKMQWNPGKKEADEEATHFMFRNERYKKVKTERHNNRKIVFVGVRTR